MDIELLKFVAQFGFAGAMAFVLLWVVIREIRDMRKAFFENAERMRLASEEASRKVVLAMNELCEAIRYLHDIEPPGMQRGLRRRTDGGTPTPRIIPNGDSL